MFVTINAFDQNRLAIDTKLSILDLDLTKADPVAFICKHLVCAIFERQQQGVEIRLLVGPFVGIRHLGSNRDCAFDAGGNLYCAG